MARYKKPLAEGLLTVTIQKSEDKNEKVEQMQKTIDEIFSSNNISCKIKGIEYFPLYTTYKYGFESYNIKKSTITDIEEMLPMYLNCQKATISFAPEEKSLLVAVSNDDRAPLPLGNVVNTIEYQLRDSDTKFALGFDEYNKAVIMDINKIDHILLSGAKGTGKTGALKTIIGSMLANSIINSIQFMYISDKNNELEHYDKCSRFRFKQKPENEKGVIDALWDIKYEIDRRLKLFESSNVVNIEQYNEILAKSMEILPHLIIVIDELDDVVSINKTVVQNYLSEIGKKGGKAGVHLLCTTRYPNTDVIRGSIKRFFDTKISFKTQTSAESRAMDIEGAENLIGKGDGLYYDSEMNAFRRFQTAMITDDEIQKMVDYIETKSIID